MKLIKILILGVIIVFLNLNFTFAEGKVCEYREQINKCKIAYEKGLTKNIDDFVCIEGTDEERIYQIILDEEFKKLDNQMDKYIENLEANKNKYFGREKKKTFIEGINDIHNVKNDFNAEYKKLCSTVIVTKSSNCMLDGIISIGNTINFFSDRGTSCSDLIDIKIEIFDDVTFNILMLNKGQIKADEKKTYDQGQRKNYNRLLDIMMINLGYLERIWQKTPTILANPYKG